MRTAEKISLSCYDIVILFKMKGLGNKNEWL